MALSQFPAAMDRAADAALRSGDLLRHITTSSGDLTYQVVDDLHAALRDAKGSAITAIIEGRKNPAAAEPFMRDMGGPVTLDEFEAKVTAIETAAAAFNAALASCLAAVPSSDLVSIQALTAGGLTTSRRVLAEFIPAIHADPLRADPVTAALLSAFEDVGA